MLYTSYFKDIKNKLYTIKITTNGDSTQTKELQLSAEPITTTFEGSDDTLYKPVKYSSTTVRILSDNYLFDLYSSKAQQNKVELLDNTNTVRWIGYTTPNLYSQGYENPIEEFEVECIDALSTLQYIDYTPITEVRSIVTFVELISHLLSNCNAYKYFYISNVTFNPNYSSEYFWEKLSISEMNFFDEDGDAMKMDEVLEELCKFMGVTCVADGESVYFIDYDGIKTNNNTYYKYEVGNITTPSYVDLVQHHSIVSKDYVKNGGTLSVGEVYNKVTITSKLYSFDYALPPIFDDKVLVNYGGNQTFTENLSIIPEDGKGGEHQCYFRFYKNPNYQSYYYTKNLVPIDAPTTMNYKFIQDNVGATILRGYFKKKDNNIINKLSLKDYLLLHSHDTNTTAVYDGPLANAADPIDVNEDLGVKIFESTPQYPNCFIGGRKVYFIINAKYLQMDRKTEMYIMDGYGNKNDDFAYPNLYIKAKLEFNGECWNGVQWVTDDVCFKIPFTNDDDEVVFADHHINQSFNIKNNITWDMGLGDSGYAIPLTNFGICSALPKLTLYSPHRVEKDYRCDAVWLEDFNISVKVAHTDLDYEDTDTEYSNVINEKYIEEFDDDFKICTWDGKKPNYSAVGQINGANLLYLDTTENKASGMICRQEEHYIYRLVNQYSTPTIILDINLHNDYKMYSLLTDTYLKKDFVIDSVTIDYFWERAELKLIEKK